MREIKFRAWDKEEGKWFENVFEAHVGRLSHLIYSMTGSLLLRTLEGVEHVSDRFEIVWSTGLKDKNGVEIYEGDLVTNQGRNGGKPHPVIWDAGEGRWAGHYMELSYSIAQETRPEYGPVIEIIGNRFENPELTEGGEHEG